jgi:phosphomannomutase
MRHAVAVLRAGPAGLRAGSLLRDGAWGLGRRSATEPTLRVSVEARSQLAVDELHAKLRMGQRAAPT